MKHKRTLCIWLAILLGCASFGCHPHNNGGSGKSKGTDDKSNRNDKASTTDDRADRAVTPDNKSNANGSDQLDDEDQVSILKTQNRVFLKPKGAADFVQIIKDAEFHSGDTLRVGESSKALVLCKNPCFLGTGDYTRCCIDSCEVAVDIQPPGGEERSFFMRKEDLTGEQARVFAERESKISSFGLASTTTQFLRAHLYTSWKLSEAAGEVQKLDDQMDKPEAKQQLGQVYAAVMLKTGDLLVKVDQKDKAVVRYKKTIDLPPDPAMPPDRSGTEKATAHRRLSEIYNETGKKAEAAESLNRAKEIYVRQGDEKKAQAIDRRKLTMRQP